VNFPGSGGRNYQVKATVCTAATAPAPCESPEEFGVSSVAANSAAGLDGWSNFNEVFTSWVLPAGVVTEWTFEARRTTGVTLQVWRGSGSTWTLVGQNIFPTTTVGLMTYTVPEGERITTQAGDVMGIRHHGQSVIPFTGGATMRWGPNNGHQSTANTIGQTVNFPGSGGRNYQVKATVCPAGICPAGYTAIDQNLDGTGKVWSQPHPDPSRTIEDCAAICNARTGCTGFEFAAGASEHGACGTYTGGRGNVRGDERRTSDGSNWRSCLVN